MKDMNYEIGMDYARNGKYREAFEYLEKAANTGDFNAINDFGVVCERLELYDQALELYELAGCGGVATAIYNIGNFYEKGIAKKQNFNAARRYYEYSAKLGYNIAYKQLAKLYLYGIGVDKDLVKANEYLKQGTKLEKKTKFKHNDCLNALAYNYSEGLGIKQNNKKAFKLWKMCANHGDINSIYNIAVCYLEGECVKRDVNKGLELLSKLACKFNYGYALKMLSYVYSIDDFGIKDLNEAGHWIIEGCQTGEIHCLLKAAEICFSGVNNEYGIDDEVCEHALRDFLIKVNGSEKEYESEINEYNKLKDTYKDKIDWELLETVSSSDDARRVLDLN